MARNTGKGHRQGPVKDRTQQNHGGTWVKTDRDGNVVGAKQGAPFKGVPKR